MLEGAKRVVFFPYSQRHLIYPIPFITTENKDEIYMAEGIHRRFDLFPNMAKAEAYEGIINEGDLLYIPCMGIHVFESVGPSLGLRYASMDALGAKCGRDLEATGSKSQMRHFVNYASTMKEFSTSEENTATTLKQLREELSTWPPQIVPGLDI
jgi:hypothetical protein